MPTRAVPAGARAAERAFAGSVRVRGFGVHARLTVESGRGITVGAVGRYRISQLAERVGVAATTLRYYETRGLLPAQRTAGGYRSHDDRDVERVRFIATAKGLGLPLIRIRDLLAVRQDGMCRDVRARLLSLVADRIADLDRRVQDLHELRRRLDEAHARPDAMPSRDTPCDPDCVIGREPRADDDPEDVAPPVPIACSLPADEYTDRVARWQAALSGTVSHRLDDRTVRTGIPHDRAGEIAGLAADEVLCCPFFTFTLAVTGAGLHLDATAPADARPLLDDLFTVAPTNAPGADPPAQSRTRHTSGEMPD